MANLGHYVGGFSEARVQKLVFAGKIPFVKREGQIMFNRNAIDRWIVGGSKMPKR